MLDFFGKVLASGEGSKFRLAPIVIGRLLADTSQGKRTFQMLVCGWIPVISLS
jgi:hypothetical protein